MGQVTEKKGQVKERVTTSLLALCCFQDIRGITHFLGENP